MNAFAEDEGCADCAYGGGTARPAHALADAIDAVNSGAVRAQQIGSAEAFELVCCPIHLRIGGGEEMETAEDGVDRLVGKFALGHGQGVDNASVSATGYQNQPLRGVDDQRLVFRNVVFDQARGSLHFARIAPVALRINAGHRAGEPCAGKNFFCMVMDNKFAARSLIFFFDGDHGVVFAACCARTAVEDSSGDVRAR